MECEGKTVELGQGGFNYTPRKMVHRAWTKPGEGALLFLTVDAAWDIHWVDDPPPREAVTGTVTGRGKRAVRALL